MAQRNTYWSCSKLSDRIRGTVKGGAKTGSGWREWEANAKQKHPIRYWIAEKILDVIQNVIWWPLDKIYDAKYYINNRWVTKTHALAAHPRDIRPGTWYDVGDRFLPCLFNELVDFVEIELAWCHIACGCKKDRRKYDVPFWATGWFRWRTWRSAQAGLDHLEWASKLTFDEERIAADDPKYKKLTPQALGAIEIREPLCASGGLKHIESVLTHMKQVAGVPGVIENVTRPNTSSGLMMRQKLRKKKQKSSLPWINCTRLNKITRQKKKP